MAGMIKNIFGLDTEDVLKERAERNRLLAAQRIKQGDIDPTVAILGQQFGDMLGRGLMKKLGYEDPDLTKAKENEALQKTLEEDLAKLDKDSSAYYNRIAEAFFTGGDYQRGAAMANIAQSIEAREAREQKAIEAQQEKDRGKPFVPKAITTKNEDKFYEDFLEREGITDIDKDMKKDLKEDLHTQLQIYKDIWKKDQDKFNLEDEWEGDSQVLKKIFDVKFLGKGKVKKESEYFGLGQFETYKR